MNYLRATLLKKAYGERLLFDQLDFTIDEGDKIALIAKNGSGKTNLLNILAGTDTSDGQGKVIINKDIQWGYLPQQPIFDEEDTVWEALFNSNNDVVKAIAAYEQALIFNEANELNPDLNQLQLAMEAMDMAQAWDFESKVKQILTRLKVNFYNKQIKDLSGGQKKRVALAGLLINQPDLLILDEPTNHLDIDMIEWLEQYLSQSNISLLLVTHDRYFLDATCTSIVELNEGKLFHYKGDYAYFIEKKQQREAQFAAETDKAANLYRKELEWMRRQPKARGTKQKARIQSFYETKEIAHRKTDQSVVQLDMKMNRLGGKVVELHQIHHQFGEQQVITDFSYVFKPGERIGIVGQNGSGKSTFLNVLTGKLTPTSGTVIHGETLKIGYYSQDGMVLKEDKRVVEVVKDIAEVVELSKGEVITASQLCKRFLFDDKTQYTYVNKLSGGEKRRLFLLTVLIQNPNFLILDEPTNDLDIDTLNVLEEFLEQYKGCLLVVTHDRYFMDKLAEHLFVFDGKGNIRDFNGNYQDYLNEVQEIKDQEKNLKSAKPNDIKTFTNEATVAKKKLSFKEAKELETLSSEIAALEQEKAELNEKLNSGNASHDELLKWSQRVEEIQDLLEEKELRWLELDERN